MSTVTLTTTPTVLDAGTAFDLSLVNSGSLNIHVEISGGSLGLLYHEILRPNQQATVYPHGYPVSAFTDAGTSSVDVTSGDNPQLNASREAAQDALAAGALVKTANLSDLASPSTARTNLGLGTAATHPDTDFLTPSAASATYQPRVGLFHVAEYGAFADSNGLTGNGTDNQAAFQAAIDAAASNGGMVMLNPTNGGYYRCTDQLVLPSGVSFAGYGPASRLFHDSVQDEPSIIAKHSSGVYTSTTVVNPTSQRNAGTIRDFTFRGRGTFVADGHPIYVWGAAGFTVENVEVEDSNCISIVADGVIGGPACEDIIIRGCHVHDGRADGIKVTRNARRVVITGNDVHDVADDMISVGYEGYVEYATVTGNTLNRGGSRGIAVMGGPGGITRYINVAGNTTFDTVLAGIYEEITQGDLADVHVSGNLVGHAGMFVPDASLRARGSGVPAGIFLDTQQGSGSTNLYWPTVVGNHVYGSRNGQIFLGNISGAASTGTIQTAMVADNRCEQIVANGAASVLGTGGASKLNTTGSRYPGVWLNHCEDAKVSGNMIVSTQHEAVLIDGTNAGVIFLSDNLSITPNQSGASPCYAFAAHSGSVSADGNVTKLSSDYGTTTVSGNVDTTGATVIQSVNNPAPAA